MTVQLIISHCQKDKRLFVFGFEFYQRNLLKDCLEDYWKYELRADVLGIVILFYFYVFVVALFKTKLKILFDLR
jgi:hypothetical protein